MTDLSLEDLQRQVDICSWEMLAPHIEKSNLFIVADEIDFIDVAWAIASDQLQDVQDYLQKKQIFRLSPEMSYTWSKIPDKKFRMVILAPYLIIQEVLDS